MTDRILRSLACRTPVIDTASGYGVDGPAAQQLGGTPLPSNGSVVAWQQDQLISQRNARPKELQSPERTPAKRPADKRAVSLSDRAVARWVR